MKLTDQIRRVDLATPLSDSRKTLTSMSQLEVRLAWEGRTGLGVAPLHASRDAFDAVADLEVAASLVAGSTPFEVDEILDEAFVALAKRPLVISALDMALHDLLGRATNMPCRELWGLWRSTVGPTALSIGAFEVEQRILRAQRLASWPIIKLEMAPNANPWVVARLRAVYPGRIWIGGNGSWDAESAVAAAEIFHRSGVELLEQPIAPGTPDLLRWVSTRSPIPIVADEDCTSADDIEKLEGVVEVVNIKLAKCGGLRGAREMIRKARQAGMDVLLGSDVESVVATTAMAQLASLADHLSLDGHLCLKDDPWTGMSIDDTGMITLPSGPGLGVVPRRDAAA